MTNSLIEIKNFKSIKHITLEARKVNIFIGKPNTGKSNILESIGLLSLPNWSNIKDIIRFEKTPNLFYDEDLSEKIEITITPHNEIKQVTLNVVFTDNRFEFHLKGEKFSADYNVNYDGAHVGGGSSGHSPFKFYRFKVLEAFNYPQQSDYLASPFGGNLLLLLQTNKELRKVVDAIFAEYGYHLVFEPQEHRIKIIKNVGDKIILHPYSLVSDTLQRIVFYLAAMESNKNSTLIFEEPEAHSFPYYTKHLAERIALDKTNQYFISTHNPSLLFPILGKAPKDEVAVFVVHFEEYQTKIKPVTQEKMGELLDMNEDVFFNLERFIE